MIEVKAGRRCKRCFKRKMLQHVLNTLSFTWKSLFTFPRAAERRKISNSCTQKIEAASIYDLCFDHSQVRIADWRKNMLFLPTMVSTGCFLMGFVGIAQTFIHWFDIGPGPVKLLRAESHQSNIYITLVGFSP